MVYFFNYFQFSSVQFRAEGEGEEGRLGVVRPNRAAPRLAGPGETQARAWVGWVPPLRGNRFVFVFCALSPSAHAPATTLCNKLREPDCEPDQSSPPRSEACADVNQQEPRRPSRL